MYFIYCGHSTCVVVFSHGKYCCESFLCHFAFSSFYFPFHSSPLNCYHRIAARPSSSICVPFKNAISICPLHTILLLTEVKKKKRKEERAVDSLVAGTDQTETTSKPLRTRVNLVSTGQHTKIILYINVYCTFQARLMLCSTLHDSIIYFVHEISSFFLLCFFFFCTSFWQ